MVPDKEVDLDLAKGPDKLMPIFCFGEPEVPCLKEP